MAELLDVLEHTRALNRLLSVQRLERMLQIYRTWINVPGVEGGFALTKDELECVLEYPLQQAHADFLFATFQTQQERPRVDLITLLTSAALLCQGTLEEKAKFIFSLVDLDTEDDIVEEELALVVSTCSNGLQRLGVHSDALLELDALAIAYEAFDFVEVEDGGKMSFPSFLKWCVFHERPRALFERISFLLSMSNVVGLMHQTLQQQTELLSSSPFHRYNATHFGDPDEETEQTGVVVGPIVGKVTTSTVTLLLEVDRAATVECFAFVVGLRDGKDPAAGAVVQLDLSPHEARLFVVPNLQSGTTYAFRLLGVKHDHRSQHVARATTLRRLDAHQAADVVDPPRWPLRAINHLHPSSALTQFDQEVYSNVVHAGYTATPSSPMLTLHFSCLQIPREKVSAMLKLLAAKRDGCAEMVAEMLAQCYRDLLTRKELAPLLRYQANLIFDRNDDILFGRDRRDGSGASSEVVEALLQLAYPIWKCYIGDLWELDKNESCIEMEGYLLLLPFCTTDLDSVSTKSEGGMISHLKAALEKYPDVHNIVLATATPVVPLDMKQESMASAVSKEQTGTLVEQANIEMEWRWKLLEELVSWQRASLSRSVLLFSCANLCGYQSTLSVKDTMIHISQFVCGPLRGVNLRDGGGDDELRIPSERSHHQLVVRHGHIEYRPHFVLLVAEFGVKSDHRMKLVATTQIVHERRAIRAMVGPVVGWVSSRSARILLECDEEGEIPCVLTDRLSRDQVVLVRKTRARQPVMYSIHNLQPGRMYDVAFQGLADRCGAIFQTPFDHIPSFTLIAVSDDGFLNGKVRLGSMSENADGRKCYVGNISAHVLPESGGMYADATLHLGCVVALAHDLSHAYGLYRTATTPHRLDPPDSPHHFPSSQVLQLDVIIRDCIRRHWSTPENKVLLSRGAHIFSSLGLLRSLLQETNSGEGTPLQFLRQIHRVVEEYESVGNGIDVGASPLPLPTEKYLRRLHSGVILLTLDTLENVVSDPTTEFVQLQSSLLSTQQWDTIEALLSVEEEQQQLGGDAEGLKLLVILCDTPIVWQDAESDTKTIWQHQNDSNRSNINGSHHSTESSATAFANPWSLYPQERARLLRLIFRKKEKNPAFHVTLLCSGPRASRTTIRDNDTGCHLEQIVLGPVSSSPPSRPIIDPARTLAGGKLLDSRYSYTHEFPAADGQHPPQYCVLDLVAHARGSTSAVHFYVQDRPEARILVGPVIGRVTPKSARILIELDRAAEKCACVLMDVATGQRYATEVSVEAFTPTTFKMEALPPGSRFSISFEDVLASESGILGYVQTPPLTPLASEWVVVQHNMMEKFVLSSKPDPTAASDAETQPQSPSRWLPIVSLQGMRSYTATSSAATYTANGDTLGDNTDVNHKSFNPWFYIEEAFLSEPMKHPQLVVHLGGQVDLRRAFTDSELLALIRRLGRAAGGEPPSHKEEEEATLVAKEVRHRIQEVYRLAWGIPPLKHMLGYASNLMLLNEESDLFFSATRLKAIVTRHHHHPIPDEYADERIAHAANALRSAAFEFWQRYQNQLWVDLHDRDLQHAVAKNSTKFAFVSTLGICRMVVMNVSQEVHDLRNTQLTWTHRGDDNDSDEAATRPHKSKTKKTTTHKSGHQNILTELAKEASSSSSSPPINVFTNATWKTLEDALLTTTPSSTAAATAIQQLVVVIPADFIESTKKFPQLRPDWIRVLEKCFAWKTENRNSTRDVAIICSSERGNSLSLDVTDEKMNAKIALSCVGSISDPTAIFRKQEPKSSTKKTHSANASASSSGTSGAGGPLLKGYFSKRYTYQSTLNLPGSSQQQQRGADSTQQTGSSASVVGPTAAEQSRTFASYQYLSDYRVGFLNETLHYFPPKTSPKATLGPIVGRIFMTERQNTPADGESRKDESGEDAAEEDPQVQVTVLILLEINANAKVVCVVTDSLLNEEVRVENAMTRDRPQVFCIEGLAPERRYVYRFEGIYNGATRRGCFHTPTGSPSALNFISLSSNFSEHMELTQESLWVAILERVRVPWCGIDAILHLGGQVPVHEAAVECFQWLRRELKQVDEEPASASARNGKGKDDRVARLRRKVRKRFQQHYYLSWNLPNIREILACVSNWFVPSQADVAPFFKNQLVLHTKAAQIVIDVAKEVVAEYQLALMFLHRVEVTPPPSVAAQELQPNAMAASPVIDRVTAPSSTEVLSPTSSKVTQIPVPMQKNGDQGSVASEIPRQSPRHLTSATEETSEATHLQDASDESQRGNTTSALPSPSTADRQFVQIGEIGVFFCDMRSVPVDDENKITCNNRLQTPLNPQEHPVIGEAQWLHLENALKKKKILLLVLCMEFPLILTNTDHVNQLRDSLALRPGHHPSDDEASGNWKLYDHKALFQHWVACTRQLEQLLQLLFRWKTKRRGRDVLLLSGGMKIGLDTIIHEKETNISLRNLTCGPITANLEPFELPLGGIACPTFGGGGALLLDNRFTFVHTPLAKKNYLLTQVAITTETFEVETATTRKTARATAKSHVRSANIEAAFIVNEPAILHTLHPIEKYRRFPSWWHMYIPMGKMVFWDDTILLRSKSEDEMLALAHYVYQERSFSAAVEVFYEKYQFAETARMEELRSQHSYLQQFDLKRNLRAVFAELWKVIPETKRQQIAYFLDPFVSDFLLAYVAPPTLLNTATHDASEPIELEFFCNLCRDFVFNACLLHLAVRSQRDDAAHARAQAKRERDERAVKEAEEKRRLEAELDAEKTRLDQLRGTDPERYAKELLAKEEAAKQKREAKKQAKLELKKAERLRELEEERAIAIEQKQLDKLAETDPSEYMRRHNLLETRIRKLNESKQQRVAEKAQKQQQRQREKVE